MDGALFLSFIAATLVIVLTPGPACALASSLAVRYGPKAAVASVCGDALGSIVHIVVAVLSLQALLSMASQILPALQIAGGCFIVYLAYSAFTAAKTAQAALPAKGYRTAFVSGFFSCVTNPKAIVFFAALFPGFINPELGVVFQSLVYGAVFVTLDAVCILGYAMLALSASRSRFGERFNIERLSAFGLLGVGLLLIIKGYRELRPA